MEMNKKKIAIASAIPLVLAIPITAIIINESKTKDTNAQQVLEIINGFSNEKSKVVPTQYRSQVENFGIIPLNKETQSKYKKIAEKYLQKAKKLQENLKSTDYMTQDSGVWLGSFIYKTQMELDGYNVNSRWMGSNPTSGLFQPLNNFWNYLGDLSASYTNPLKKWVKNSSNKWVQSLEDVENESKIQDLISQMLYTTKILQDTTSNFKDAVINGVTLSGVFSRIMLSGLVKSFGDGELPETFAAYKAKLNSFLAAKKYKSIQDMTREEVRMPWFSYWQNYSNVHKNSWVDSFVKKQFSDQLTNGIKEVNKFIKYMTVDYWKAIKYGISNDSDHSKSFTDNLGRKQNSGKIVEDPKLTKLTQADLDTKDVGIGFAGPKGAKIYKHILKTQTTTDDKISKLHDNGDKNVKANKDHMLKVLQTIYEIEKDKQGQWRPVVKYDPDGPKNKGAANKILTLDNNGGIPTLSQLPDFFLWLKSERFSFGRGGNKIVDPSKVDKKWSDILDKAGYNVWKTTKANTPIDGILPGQVGATPGQTNNNIIGKKAYIGAAEALKSYNIFKEATQSKIKKHFKSVKKDFTYIPVNYRRRTVDGVGAYNGNRNSIAKYGGNFILGVDPYYGISKWSMSTLSNHEAIPGHHFQHQYNVDNGIPAAPHYGFNAFAEGWGLFSEWYAVIQDMYGKFPIDQTTGLPDYSKVPDFKTGSTNIQFSAKNPVDDFQGKDTYKTVEEYNALQYFGFLNERQLRAMRLVLDTSVHAGSKGDFTKGTGWSITEERDYMEKNSGLGLGDIQSESKRYLQYVGQATSYLTGEQKIEELYKQFRKFQQTTSDKMTLNEEKQFFGTILKNNALPLDVLYNFVHTNNQFK